MELKKKYRPITHKSVALTGDRCKPRRVEGSVGMEAMDV